jgi:catechol 2,3-dioxygenase-like lactoylglutathione lyase family enzyme
MPEISGLTLQVGVRDMAGARSFYDRLFGREPDFVPTEDVQGYETGPGAWFQITTALEPGRIHRIRFGVPDLAVARDELKAAGIEASEVAETPGVAQWCDFADPYGNPLGFYQDLSD